VGNLGFLPDRTLDNDIHVGYNIEVTAKKKHYLRIAISIFAMLALFSPASTTLADGDSITVISTQAESTFPTGITFKISATSPNVIEDIRVFFKPYGSKRSAYAVLDFEPGITAEGKYLLSTTGSNHTPPGAFISYSFEIRDGAGDMIRTEEKQALYEDNRFEWETITEGLITVYYYGPVRKRAQMVMDAVGETLRNMGPVLGIEPYEPLRIVTYNNYRHMSAALPFRSQAVSEELQTQGMAFNRERVLLVLSGEPNVVGVASHEFVHLLVAEATGSAKAAVPTWLDEGLAEYGNLDPGVEYDRALAYGIYTRRIKPLWYLTQFAGTPDDVIIAYGQSRSVVIYLINTYGVGKIPLLMQEISQEKNVDQALSRVYGFDQHGLDSEWRLWVGLEPLPSPEELAQSAETIPVPAPTAQPDLSPTLEPLTNAQIPDNTRPATSCSKGRSRTANTPVFWDLSLLALLGTPFALIMRVRHRQNPNEHSFSEFED